MFVLGTYWERDPPRTVLGLKAHVLGRFCSKVVKSPHFVVAEHEVFMNLLSLRILSEEGRNRGNQKPMF